jgi:hypothetical protein
MARLFKTGVTAEGDITTSGFLKSTNSSGDEGGQIDLTKAATNTTLTTGVTIDINQNKLRFFETGGTNRGFYIDITGGGASVGTNLVSGGSYTLPAATTTALGGIELFDGTAQSVASNAVTTTASRTYGLQVNAAGQGVINVPWTDTDTNTTYTFATGTTNGTFNFTPLGGSATAVSIFGLNSAAYTASTDYAPAAGSTNITTLGTIGTGTWNATAIADGKIASALTGKTYNKLSITAPATGSTLAVADLKTFTVSNTLTLQGTDTSTLNIGTGGTLGTAAFTASSAYATSGHAHGNVSNTGTTATTVTATNPLKVVIADSGGAVGLLSTTSASATTFLRGDGTWVTPTDTDTNTFPTTWSWSAGTTSGPTASITGTSSTISVAAVPAATDANSGIVTTSTQTFAGTKTFNNNVIGNAAIFAVGKNSTPTQQVYGYYLATDGAVIACRDAATPLYSHMINASGTVTMLQFIYNGTTNGTIRVASGGTPAFASGSDYRIKTDVTPITNAIERMKNAKAYTFYKNEEIDPSHTLHTGFLAHELADVQPDAVLGEKDEVDENGAPVYQEVMEAKIIPVMAQAINDLIGMVETLTARIEALEA